MVRKILVLLFIIFVNGFAFAQAAQDSRLAVLLVVDQMRADYFNRFGTQFTGGFKRLRTEGMVFSNATLSYATSETSPGHATIATGSYPRTHGIIGNIFIDPQTKLEITPVDDSQIEQVDDEGGRASPKNLVVETIGDWLKTTSSHSKVISISAKDYAAVLQGGHHPDMALWIDDSTDHMVTSAYYVQHEPIWVKEFNSSNWIRTHIPKAWTKLMPEDVYAGDGPDDFHGEKSWGHGNAFPHIFESNELLEEFQSSPYLDLLTMDFAIDAVHSERLGQRGVTDLLCLSLSATDYVGHSFGPDSHEMHDHLLRLDRALGEFLASLEKLVGREHLIVAMTADHGTMSIPEFLTEIKHVGARMLGSRKTVQQEIGKVDCTIEMEWGIPEQLIIPSPSYSGYFLNFSAAARHGIDRRTLETRVRDGLLRIDWIEDVMFRQELLDPTTPERPYLDDYRRSYYPPRSADLLIRLCENCLVASNASATSHGSPYSYDAHVPMIFWGAGVHAGSSDRLVHTVDVVPTLAHLIGIPIPKYVEGTPLIDIHMKSKER